MNRKILVGGSLSALLILLLTAMFAHQAQAVLVPISGQLDVGARGADVTNLQTFLAADASIYPEGLITGYYGPLTMRAVQRFQLVHGIPQVGRVGPQTLMKINALIAIGYGPDMNAPLIGSVSVQKTSNSASVSWATSELATGRVHYHTAPFVLREAIGNFTEPEIIGGSMVGSPNAMSSQSLSITGLQPNTLYYYMILVKDASGNISVTLPSTFRTN